MTADPLEVGRLRHAYAGRDSRFEPIHQLEALAFRQAECAEMANVRGQRWKRVVREAGVKPE